MAAVFDGYGLTDLDRGQIDLDRGQRENRGARVHLVDQRPSDGGGADGRHGARGYVDKVAPRWFGGRRGGQGFTYQFVRDAPGGGILRARLPRGLQQRAPLCAGKIEREFWRVLRHDDAENAEDSRGCGEPATGWLNIPGR